MTFRELLKAWKKEAKKKGLLDAEIEGTVLSNTWKYQTFVTLIDPVDGDKRHMKFGYKEARKVNGINEEPEPFFKNM